DAVDIGEKIHVLLPELEQVDAMHAQYLRCVEPDLEPLYSCVLRFYSDFSDDTPMLAMLSLALRAVQRGFVRQICRVMPPLSALGCRQLAADAEYISSVAAAFVSTADSDFDVLLQCVLGRGQGQDDVEPPSELRTTLHALRSGRSAEPKRANAPVWTARAESKQLAYVLLLGSMLRLGLLLLFPDLTQRWLAGRVELSTPVTSFKRLAEGLHLSARGISPYDGGVFHQSPLLLLVFRPLYYLPDAAMSVAFVAADALVALGLAKLAGARAAQLQRSAGTAVPGETRFICRPSVAAMLYLFNPLAIATALARSTIVFSHAAIVGALYLGTQGLITGAVVCAAVATHLSLYPAMLIAPIALMAGSGRGIVRTVIMFACTIGMLHVLFVAIYGAEYFAATVDFTVRVGDLQPTVGLFWYFFIEIFDEFRAFFIVVFQLTALAFAVPVAWRFRHDPLFAATMLVGIISALKSYPAWGDLALFLGLLPVYEDLLKYLQYTFLSANLLLYGIGLAPVFWYLWIEQGSGNANFFYAATLVYVFGQIALLFDLGSAMLRRSLDIHHPETRNRTVIQD
ncbi:hypothetical protein IWW52_004397, partial [Coemansia sp. RSA 2704]